VPTIAGFPARSFGFRLSPRADEYPSFVGDTRQTGPRTSRWHRRQGVWSRSPGAHGAGVDSSPDPRDGDAAVAWWI